MAAAAGAAPALSTVATAGPAVAQAVREALRRSFCARIVRRDGGCTCRWRRGALRSDGARSGPRPARPRPRSGQAGDEPRRQEPPAHQVEIGEAEHRERPGRVLRQPSVPHLSEAPEPLDHMKRMFAARPPLRAPAIAQPLPPGQASLRGAFRLTRYRPPRAVQCCRWVSLQ